MPESWHEEKVGTYSSNRKVPKIDGGEFIVGKFEETLPDFFSVPRPMASVINFDADLYSSTICALNNSKEIIDKKTILIFDDEVFGDFITGTALTGPLAGEYGEPEMTLVLKVLSGIREG